MVAKNAQKGPLSREATVEQLEAAIKPGLERELKPLTGNSFYHIGVGVDAYILAVPGVPLAFSPKSALVVTVNVWDDATGERLIEEDKRFTILERISGHSLLGSGLTQNAQEQLDSLADSAVRRIIEWLRENEAVFQSASVTTSES